MQTLRAFVAKITSRAFLFPGSQPRRLSCSAPSAWNGNPFQSSHPFSAWHKSSYSYTRNIHRDSDLTMLYLRYVAGATAAATMMISSTDSWSSSFSGGLLQAMYTHVHMDAPASLKNLNNINPPTVVLYQYEPCPFCNKVRAYLDYQKIPYECIEVNPLTKNELSFSTYRKVPVATINGIQVNGSANIISTVHNYLNGIEIPQESPPADPKSDQENNPTSIPISEDEQKWISWIDTYLVKLLPPNIYRTKAESFQTFEYLTEVSNFTSFQKSTAKYVGAVAMYMIGKNYKKKYNIDDPRQALYDAVNLWIDSVEHQSKLAASPGHFHGGAKPDLADIQIFGVLRSLKNFDTFSDLMENSRVSSWYQRMEFAVGPSARIYPLQNTPAQASSATA